MTPVRVPFCDLARAHGRDGAEVERALIRVARSGRYVLGGEVEAFERDWASRCGVGHAVGVGSGTAALALALRAGGVRRGDEVLVPALTAPASWMAVTDVGARPVGVDVDERTGLIDPAAAAAACGPRTAAIVAVHLFGRLAPMAKLRELCGRAGLLLVEDAAHAHAADEGDGPAGSLGDVAAFSFYPTKLLGALGDAGAVVTGNAALAEEVRRLRSYGWTAWQGDVDRPGTNSRLDAIQAAVLRVRLARLDADLARVRELACLYRERLAAQTTVELPPLPPAGTEPAWHQFVVRHPRRDDLRAALAQRGVGTALHYDPIPPQLRAFAAAGRFPAAERRAATGLSLPLDAWLSEDQVLTVCGALAAEGRSVTLSAGS